MTSAARKTLVPILAVLAFVTIAYSNHFENGFHFDDAHTVSNNPWIRDLANIPRIFTDADTFSTLPTNRGWRPIVTMSLAIDYALAGGLKPFWFQASTFFWFLLQLCLMYVLFRGILDLARPAPLNPWIALFATALYGVHPAMAETVNYVIQRGDVYSTLAVVAGLVVYIRWPERRGQYLYLIPVAIGLMSKPPALIFPAILFAYIVLFEELPVSRAIVRCVPALTTAAIFGVLSAKMTPKSYDPGAVPAFAYRITQPLVALRYFRSFFQPIHLSADTDHPALTGIFDGYAWVGILFVLAMIAGAVWCGRERRLRPIAFGIWWFLLALLPTSIFALAEVENDHRMFFPFVGLSLSICYSAALIYAPRTKQQLRITAVACAAVLIAAAAGTRERNAVWHSDESLWYDVTEKSPNNGRGLMNYGLTQMSKGAYDRALDYFTRALVLTPNYYTLEINIGIVNGAMKQDAEAEGHFLRAMELAPNEAQTRYYYSSWLNDHGRRAEAIQHLNKAIAANPSYIDAQYLLMKVYADQGNSAMLRQTAQEVLQRFPNDTVAQARLR